MPVSKRTRFEVLKRDNYRCRYCGDTSEQTPLTLDHVLPVSLGGSDDASNLVAACRDCNYGKASSSPDASLVDDVSQDALRWSRAMQEAGDVLTQQDAKRVEYCNAFLEKWTSYGHGWMPDDYESSISALYQAGLPVKTMLEMVEVAKFARGIESSRFNYFMGCCWKRVAKLQEIAQQIMAAEGAE